MLALNRKTGNYSDDSYNESPDYNYKPSLFPETIADDEWVITDRDQPGSPAYNPTSPAYNPISPAYQPKSSSDQPYTPGTPPFRYSPHSPPGTPPFRYSPHSPPGTPPPLALSIPSTQIKIKDPELKAKWDKIPEKEQKKMAEMILKRKADKSKYAALDQTQKQVIKEIISEQKQNDLVPLSQLMAEESKKESFSSLSEKINPTKVSILNNIEEDKSEKDLEEDSKSSNSSKGSKQISFNL